MPKLRQVDCSSNGWTRRKAGRGFYYLDDCGNRLTDEVHLERIRRLAIPPAWTDVWICPHPYGHIQATGYDTKGRRQYRYHDVWRSRKDQEKFDHMIEFGHALPELRNRIALDLSSEDMSERRVLACAVRLLDLGFFRIGGEDYAEENSTYGLATMKKRHVTLEPESMTVTFDYTAKASKHRVQAIVDPEVYVVVEALKKRTSGGNELLAYKAGRAWRDVKSQQINHYVQDMTGSHFTAKDFRTWNATVLMSVALAVADPVALQSEAARKRAISRAVTEVSDYLGNTPAVARSSYIDPRVIDCFANGETIVDSLDRLGVDCADGHPATQGAVEAAVLDLLTPH